MASLHLVKYPIVVIINLWPLDDIIKIYQIETMDSSSYAGL